MCDEQFRRCSEKKIVTELNMATISMQNSGIPRQYSGIIVQYHNLVGTLITNQITTFGLELYYYGLPPLQG